VAREIFAMKTIVVTGTDRGLGLALAEAALLAGSRVFLTCLEPKGEVVRALAGRFPDRAEIVRLDIGDAASVAAAAAAIRSRAPAIDRLINNAAILGDIEHTVGEPGLNCDEVLRVIGINAVGPLRVTHALWELLAAGNEKLLVNLSSEAGSIGQNWRDRWFGYCLSKAALNMEGALIHERLRQLGGRVMLVHPGYVRSFMLGARNEKATYEPAEAARLVFAAIERRTTQPAGQRPDFFDLHGKDLPW
jgi:NAD(P)-dependent dehydrogenase (short-subunit alcohol dehydrogenase family)